MNLHTFQDALNSRKASLANDLDEDEDETAVGSMRGPVDGEEDDGTEKFNEAGEVLEPFNLRNERQSGHFDENMNFVFKKERGEIDAWLADMDESTMEQSIGEAADAFRKREEQRLAEEAKEASKTKRSAAELRADLLKYLQPRETVAQAMRRLSGKPSQLAPSYRRLHGKANTAAVPAPVVADKAALEALTEVADDLLLSGYSSIYETTYEAIENSTVQWEYQGLDGQVHGPFTASQIAGWKQQGFFTGDSAVMMRRVLGTAATTIDNNNINSGSISSGVSVTAPSSGGQERQVGGKARFDQGPGAGESKQQQDDGGSNKRSKSTSEEVAADFEDSDDDDDDDNGKAPAAGAPGSVVAAKPSVTVNYNDLPRGPWTSSDDDDFGQHIENDDDDEDEKILQSRKKSSSSSTGKAAGAGLLGARGGGGGERGGGGGDQSVDGSSSRMRREAKGKYKKRVGDDDQDEDDDEDGGDDGEEEGDSDNEE